ncbi:HAD family hydrolase [Halovenus halobia]|uniref:HAD family hydrolase n=1 Tax=Halovenus halobia TaxID=3396622 RepID=UPI003F54A67F
MTTAFPGDGTNTVPMSQYEAVLFDMDGVTVETATVWRDLEQNEILPAAVAGEPPIEKVRGLSVTDAYDRLSTLDGTEVTVSAEEFDALYDDNAAAVYRERATLMDGCVELLEDLQAEKYATGLVSASRREWVEMVLDRFDLDGLYDVVVSSSDFEGPSKPDPTTYRVAAEKLGVEPEECMVIEDSPHGIDAAAEAGMYCIALRGAGNADSDLSRANRIVMSTSELRAVLAEMWVLGDQ